MVDYIQNTNCINEEGDIVDDLKLINESTELENIVHELVDSVIQTEADFYLENGNSTSKTYRPINFLVTLFGILKEQDAIQKATGEYKPVYLIRKRKSYRTYTSNPVYHLYFFIGTYDEIKNKLTKLSEYEDNLEKTHERYHIW